LVSFSVKEKLKSGELVVTGDQWPIFLYAAYAYDPEDPWNGLLQSNILVSVSNFILPFSEASAADR
jgi:hypothetical protein